MALSMGYGDFMSSRTEMDMATEERMTIKWEVCKHLRLQEDQLLQRYVSLGMNINDATVLVNILAKYKDILTDEEMETEKGMLPPERTGKPWKNGLVTLAAFILFGSGPLLGFIVLFPFTQNETYQFIGACHVLSVLALVPLGAAKAKIAGQKYVLSAATTVFNCAIAGAAAYGIGSTLRNFAGIED